MKNGSVRGNEPYPRLCHIRRWPHFQGYGFNLHCEKAKPGQYIGKVDDDSPASSAGLREHDRIIEVNFVPIGTENHRQVVARIKEGVTRNETKYPEEVILLVLDPDADTYFKSKSILVKSSDPNVRKLQTAMPDDPGEVLRSPCFSCRFLSSFVVDQADDVSEHSIDRDSPVLPKPQEKPREYTRVADFTGPTVTQTTKVSRRRRRRCLPCFILQIHGSAMIVTSIV